MNTPIFNIQEAFALGTALGKPASESENPQRLYTVRGHFKTCTAEHPLFGKYTGTYWWVDCIKGNMDIGIVEKDYCIYIEPDIFKNSNMKMSR